MRWDEKTYRDIVGRYMAGETVATIASSYNKSISLISVRIWKGLKLYAHSFFMKYAQESGNGISGYRQHAEDFAWDNAPQAGLSTRATGVVVDIYGKEALSDKRLICGGEELYSAPRLGIKTLREICAFAGLPEPCEETLIAIKTADKKKRDLAFARNHYKKYGIRVRGYNPENDN